MLIPSAVLDSITMLGRMSYTEWIDATELARGFNSTEYARKVLQELARHGVAEGIRGRTGGYRRVKEHVTLGELCECFTAVSDADRVICVSFWSMDIAQVAQKINGGKDS